MPSRRLGLGRATLPLGFANSACQVKAVGLQGGSDLRTCGPRSCRHLGVGCTYSIFLEIDKIRYAAEFVHPTRARPRATGRQRPQQRRLPAWPRPAVHRRSSRVRGRPRSPPAPRPPQRAPRPRAGRESSLRGGDRHGAPAAAPRSAHPARQPAATFQADESYGSLSPVLKCLASRLHWAVRPGDL